MWVKLDDAILDNPKILRAGFIGFGVHVAGIAYCGRNLTDGFVAFEKVATLVDLSVLFTNAGYPLGNPRDEIKGGAHSPDVYGVVDELVDIGLWHEVEREGALVGYRIHDYLKYNPSRAEVLTKREKEREKKQKKQKSLGDSPGDSLGDSGGNLRHPVPVPVPVPPERSISLLSIAAVPSRHSARAKPKTPWPDGFTLTSELRRYAERNGLDAEYEWGKFKAHAERDDVRHANWPAAWQYWIRNAWEIAGRQARR